MYKFHSQLLNERCIFSDGMKTLKIPLKIQLQKRKYFKQKSKFEVIYKHLKTIKYKIAVVQDESLTDVQGSIVMNKAVIQNLAAQNIHLHQSFNKEEQNVILYR